MHECIFYIFSGKILSIAELYAFSQGKGIGQSVITYRVTSGQPVYNLSTSVIIYLNVKQTVKYIQRNHVVLARSHSIHCGNICAQRNIKHLAV